jgi:hypothetical protein
MHRVIFLRVGSRKLHLLKLMGACLFFSSALYFLNNIYRIFETSDKLMIYTRTPSLAEAAGFYGGISVSDIIGVLMEPVAQALLWLVFFTAGFVIYRAGYFILPLEEEVDAVKAKQKKKR